MIYTTEELRLLETAPDFMQWWYQYMPMAHFSNENYCWGYDVREAFEAGRKLEREMKGEDDND